jgi:hypothetical protein
MGAAFTAWNIYDQRSLDVRLALERVIGVVKKDWRLDRSRLAPPAAAWSR